MSQASEGRMFRKWNFAALGLSLGAGIALVLSELGFEVELAVGMVLGLCIGTYIDKQRA